MSDEVNRRSKTKDLEDALIQEIKTKFSKPHSLFYSEREIIEKFQLHRTTVRQVLKTLTDKGYLYRINGKGTFVSPTAKMKQVLVVQKAKENILKSGSYAQIEFDDGLTKVIQQDDLPYMLIKIDYQDFIEIFDEIELIYKNLSGIIFYSNISLLKLTKDAMDSKGIPYLYFGSNHNINSINIPHVVYDQREVVTLALDHLYEQGHRGIGFVYTSDSTVRNQRLDEYRSWMGRKGLEIKENFIIDLSFHFGIKRRVKYSEISEQLKEIHPVEGLTAVLSADDLVALYFINSAIRAGISIPNEISVIGINDYPICPDIIVPLTTVSIPFYEAGKKSMRKFDTLSNQPKRVCSYTLPSKVVERESVIKL